MKAVRCRHICILTLGFAIFVGVPFAPAQQVDPKLQEVFDAWKKRQGRTKSVLYKLSGEALLPKGSFPDWKGVPQPNVPPRDITFPIRRTLLLDFATGRSRDEMETQKYHPQTDKLYSEYYRRPFDGKEIKYYHPRERNTHPDEWKDPSQCELGIGSGYMGGAAYSQNLWPMLLGHGTVPWYHKVPLPGQLKVVPDIDTMYALGRAVHRGRTCQTFRTQAKSESFEEWWVDTARDGAVMRYTSYLRTYPHMDLDIEYGQTAHGWLPKRWTFTIRTPSTGKLEYEERMRVDQLLLDPGVTDADFDIEIRPGMLVARVTTETPAPGKFATKGKTRLYRAEKGGGLREVIFEKGVERPAPSFPRSAQGSRASSIQR